MKAHRVFQFGAAVELEDPFAVLGLTIEVFVHLVGQLGQNHSLAIVVPVGIDSHQQMGLVPFDRIALDVTFAGMGGVEPKAKKAVFPDGAGGVSAPVISRAWLVRIAWPASGLQIQTLRSRQS